MIKRIKQIIGQIRYAMNAPNFRIAIIVIWQAMNGCTGADNIDEIREKLNKKQRHE